MILHWNGLRWTCAHIPDNLDAVATSSADNAWAVGGSAWHWNGHTWKQTMTPQPGGGVGLGVAVIPSSGRDAWAVGDTGDRTLMLHWNGTARQ